MTFDDRPRIYLDFDGVLNPWPFEGDYERDFVFDRDLFYKNAYRLHASTEVLRALAALPGRLTWLTTWMLEDEDLDFLDTAFGQDLGIPDRLEVHARFGGSFKSRTFDAHHRAGDPFVWIDDDALPARRLEEGLYIEPDGEIGLTKTHITVIEEFLTENRIRAPRQA